jgi:hypothetical protein
MGEIADAMLDGTLCACCGAYMGSDAGFPQYCSRQCTPDELRDPELTKSERIRKRQRERVDLPRFNPYSIPPRDGTVQCEHCPRWIKPVGMAQHIRDKHPEKMKREN